MESDMRNVKDFLVLFNKLSERCFRRCVYDLGQVGMTPEESSCIENCISKNINFNHKIMSLYMEINPPFQQRKMEEQQAQIQKLRDEQQVTQHNSTTVAEPPRATPHLS